MATTWPPIAIRLVNEHPDLVEEFFEQVSAAAFNLLSLQTTGLPVSVEQPGFYKAPPPPGHGVTHTHMPVKVDLERIVVAPYVSSEDAAAMSPEAAAAATLGIVLGTTPATGRDLVAMLSPGHRVLRVRQDLASIEECLASRQPIVANVAVPGFAGGRNAFLVVGYLEATHEFTLINASTKIRVPFATLVDPLLTAELYVVDGIEIN